MLTYLKQQKIKKHVNLRFINIIICSMQIITPLAAYIAFVITVGQEPKFSMIIKSFVTLGFMTTVDNLFIMNFPKEIIKNAITLNQSGSLKLGEDHNTFQRIFARIKRKKKEPVEYLIAVANCTVNLWWIAMTNFQIIIYNYFAPYIVLLL